jgi:hypothetical protein
MLEQICDFPYSVIMVCKCGPFGFVGFLSLCVCLVFNSSAEFFYGMDGVFVVFSYCFDGFPFCFFPGLCEW